MKNYKLWLNGDELETLLIAVSCYKACLADGEEFNKLGAVLQSIQDQAFN